MITDYPLNVYTKKACKVLEFLNLLWTETKRRKWTDDARTFAHALLYFNENGELTASSSVTSNSSVEDFRWQRAYQSLL